MARWRVERTAHHSRNHRCGTRAREAAPAFIVRVSSVSLRLAASYKFDTCEQMQGHIASRKPSLQRRLVGERCTGDRGATRSRSPVAPSVPRRQQARSAHPSPSSPPLCCLPEIAAQEPRPGGRLARPWPRIPSPPSSVAEPIPIQIQEQHGAAGVTPDRLACPRGLTPPSCCDTAPLTPGV